MYKNAIRFWCIIFHIYLSVLIFICILCGEIKILFSLKLPILAYIYKNFLQLTALFNRMSKHHFNRPQFPYPPSANGPPRGRFKGLRR